MSLLDRLCQLLCGCFESDSAVPVPTGFNFSSPRQIDERIQEEIVLAKTDIAVMEVDLPDATLAKNVDLQILKVTFPEHPIYDQELKLPKTARVAQFIVPEGVVYTLTLGYADDNGDRGLQVTWAESVTLTHIDTLYPDAPGPFGEIRMIDEYEEETDGQPPVPGGEPSTEEPPTEEPPTEEPPTEEPPTEESPTEEPPTEGELPVEDEDSTEEEPPVI